MISNRRSFLTSSALLGAAVLTGRAAASGAASATPARSGSTDFWEVLKTRRSVRRFRPEVAVPDSDITQILDAARLAPTSGNQQPWKFLVIRDPARIKALKEGAVEFTVALMQERKPVAEAQQNERRQRVRASLEGYFSAPVFILVLTDTQSKYPDYNHWDGPLAAGNLMLAARALGYGTVFLTDSVPDEVTRKVLSVPDRYTRVCLTPLGVPVEWPAAPSKKPLSDFIAFETL